MCCFVDILNGKYAYPMFQKHECKFSEYHFIVQMVDMCTLEHFVSTSKHTHKNLHVEKG
jgi:hypothetical protein